MSWQDYVDKSLISTGNIDKAAIFSAGGDSVWAASRDFKVEAKEVEALIRAYGDNAIPFEKGIYISGIKYFGIKADTRSIYGRKEKTGILCVKTKKAIIVAHYPDTVQTGEAAKVVEGLADYLIGVGY